MMNVRFLAAAAAALAATVPATGQSILQLDVPRIERAWPATSGYGGGIDLDLACGAFVPNSDGRSVAVIRHGQLFLSFQPTGMHHFVAAGGNGATAIATVAAIDQGSVPIPTVWEGTDRLAVVTSEGLSLRSYTTEFATVPGASWGPIASWAGAADLDAGIYGGGALRARYVLGHAPGWVQVAMVHPQLGLLPVLTLPAAPGASVLDAALVDWDAGDAPEVVVMHSNGAFVMNVAGTVLASTVRPTTAGQLVAWRHNQQPAVTMVRASGGQWQVSTWKPAGTTGVWSEGGFCDLASAPTGLSLCAVDSDAELDLIISTSANHRDVVCGTEQGPSVADHFQIIDVRPVTLPGSYPANVAPAVVTDLDQDGAEDLVIASSAGDRLVVLPRLQAEVVAFSTGTPPAQSTTNLGMLRPRGWFLDSPEGPALGLRLLLPTTWQQTSELRVVVYQVASDDAVPQAMWHHKFQLTGAGTRVDVLVPLPRFIADTQRYFLEVFLTNGAGKSSPRLWLDTIVTGFQTDWAGVQGLLPPPATMASLWWFDVGGAPLPAPLPHEGGLFTGPGSEPNRYFGVLPLVKSKPVNSGSPVIPTPSLKTGATVHNDVSTD
jgi:hypothetical protein